MSTNFEMRAEASLNFEPSPRGADGLRRRDANAAMREWRGSIYGGSKRTSEKDAPRPAWMEDPSLLPKRPPGRAA